LKHAYDYVANHVGEETARRLCVTNPLVAVEGASWPEQPTPKGLWELEPLRFAGAPEMERPRRERAKKGSPEGADGDEKRGFWNRLFGR